MLYHVACIVFLLCTYYQIKKKKKNNLTTAAVRDYEDLTVQSGETYLDVLLQILTGVLVAQDTVRDAFGVLGQRVQDVLLRHT